MKRMINTGRTFILTILIMLGTAQACLADALVLPDLGNLNIFSLTVCIWFLLFAVCLVSLLCMLIAKLTHSEKLLDKSKNICEKSFYYNLVMLGLMLLIFFAVMKGGYGLLTVLLFIASLILRLKLKKKGWAYAAIAGYMVLTIVLLFV